MSVDYESVLIYGYRIPSEEVERLRKDIGEDAWINACETYDGTEHYSLMRDNAYYGVSDYYFGVTLGSELHLDAVDSICWHEYETEAMEAEFEKIFGDLSYVDSECPLMYHFVRVY